MRIKNTKSLLQNIYISQLFSILIINNFVLSNISSHALGGYFLFFSSLILLASDLFIVGIFISLLSIFYSTYSIIGYLAVVLSLIIFEIKFSCLRQYFFSKIKKIQNLKKLIYLIAFLFSYNLICYLLGLKNGFVSHFLYATTQSGEAGKFGSMAGIDFYYLTYIIKGFSSPFILSALAVIASLSYAVHITFNDYKLKKEPFVPDQTFCLGIISLTSFFYLLIIWLKDFPTIARIYLIPIILTLTAGLVLLISFISLVAKRSKDKSKFPSFLITASLVSLFFYSGISSYKEKFDFNNHDKVYERKTDNYFSQRGFI